jgi:hypothetical protein
MWFWLKRILTLQVIQVLAHIPIYPCYFAELLARYSASTARVGLDKASVYG